MNIPLKWSSWYLSLCAYVCSICGCTITGCLHEYVKDKRGREKGCDVLVCWWGGLELCLMSQTKSWLDWAEMNK